MPANVIAQLIIALGPVALELIPKLAAVWSKPELTADEVLKICEVSEKTYEEYVRPFDGAHGKPPVVVDPKGPLPNLPKAPPVAEV